MRPGHSQLAFRTFLDDFDFSSSSECSVPETFKGPGVRILESECGEGGANWRAQRNPRSSALKSPRNLHPILLQEPPMKPTWMLGGLSKSAKY